MKELLAGIFTDKMFQPDRDSCNVHQFAQIYVELNSEKSCNYQTRTYRKFKNAAKLLGDNEKVVENQKMETRKTEDEEVKITKAKFVAEFPFRFK
jgi:hypothetical protein